MVKKSTTTATGIILWVG